MRNILATKSYMDETLPQEITIKIYLPEEESNLSVDERDEYYYQLEQYNKIYNITNKWYKLDKSLLFIPVTILSKEEKAKLSEEELIKYHYNLKKNYLLSKEQQSKRKFIKLSDEEENQKLNDDEYPLYLKDLRILVENSKDYSMSLRERKKLTPVLRLLMKASAKLSKLKIYKLNTKLPANLEHRPIIFVLTHVGKDDQVVFSDVVKEHYTILSGDFESLHNKVEGTICGKNGILYFDMRSKKDRSEICPKVENKLSEGDNILCSMEAAWNLTANQPVTELFDGMIRSALNKNALILPVGIERFDKYRYGINLATSYFDPKTYLEKYQGKELLQVAKADLRDVLADLKMQLYYHRKIADKINIQRSEIDDYDEYNEQFKKDILTGWTFDEDSIKNKRFNSKEDPNIVFDYVVKKYDNLISMYESIQNDTVPDDMKDKLIEKFKLLLVELINDVENVTYPNEIHNKLLSIFNEITVIMNSSANVESVDFKK